MFWDKPKTDVWHQAYQAAEDQVTDLRAEVRRLTDIIVEMRREGFNPGAKPDVIAVEDDLSDVVMQAIHARAAPNSDTFRLLVRGAREMLMPDGSNSNEVADLVLRGANPDEDE